MIKNVMVSETFEMKLDELFWEAWKGNLILDDEDWKVFVSNKGNKVKVQKGSVLGGAEITDDDLFEVELKTKITDRTVFSFLVTVHKSDYISSQPYIEHHYGESIKDVLNENTIQVLAYIDDRMEIVWERS